jgi:hypothetical protein
MEDIGDAWLVKTKFGGYETHAKHMPDMRARLACTLIEKWGMVAATVADGEDSAGRSRMRLLTPAEVVGRACETAERAIEEMHRLGWMHAVEAPTE